MQNIRRIFPPDLLKSLLAGILLVVLLQGCNTRSEGCLDVNAENFDLTAEKACDGCCTYPSMGLSLTQKWNDRNFSNEDTLLDIHLDSYKIQDLKYFLSSWSWMDADGSIYTVDSVEANCNQSFLEYTPDILIADTRQFVYTMGTIRKSPLIDSIHFTFGLVEDFSCLDATDPNTPLSLTDQSPLWNPQSSSLETIRLIVQRDLSTEILDTLFITTNQIFSLKYSAQLVKGFDAQLKLSVNYAQWFQSVDRNEISSFSHSILTHLQGSFTAIP